jgi:hypothetical protein
VDPNQQPGQPQQPEEPQQPFQPQPAQPQFQPPQAEPFQPTAPAFPTAPVTPPTQQFPQPQAQQAMVQDNPGQGFGIASIVMIFVFPLLGIIFGAISRSKSKAANMPSGLGTAGLIINIILTVVGIIVGILFFILVIAVGTEAAKSGALNDETGSSSSFGTTDATDPLATNAVEVKKRADAYNALAGDYPKTTSDFAKYSESTIPEDVKVYSSFLLTNSSLTYIYCGAGSAQIVYLGDTQEDKRITALGSASSTEVCPKAL